MRPTRKALSHSLGIFVADSFSVSFGSVASAVSFCLDVQYRFLDTRWPKSILKLPYCKQIYNDRGDMIIQGPRVRMGVHWARQGTVVYRQHNLTRGWIFDGPGFKIVQEVSEAARGGQVLLTFDGWMSLRESMASAGFPVVHVLGLFELATTPGKPTWLYHIPEIVGKPLGREFDHPRNLTKLWPDNDTTAEMPFCWRLHVMPPPRVPPFDDDIFQPGALHASGTIPTSRPLSFVAVRLTSFPSRAHVNKQRARSPLHRRLTNDPYSSGIPLRMMESLEEALMQQRGSPLHDGELGRGIDMQQAQQFKGYMFSIDRNAQFMGRFCLAFKDARNALRFCHAAQMGLMYYPWSTNPEHAAYCGARGPRVAMAIHQSEVYDVLVHNPVHEVAEKVVEYLGEGVVLANHLSELTRGGQVVLSQAAWDAVMSMTESHPGAATAISLGSHILSENCEPMRLMEVEPGYHDAPDVSKPMAIVEPGYHDAPDVSEPLAVVFMKVHKPADVLMAEEGLFEEDDMYRVMTAYHMAIVLYVGIARELLPLYDGYECKESRPGEVMLVFRHLHQAVLWCTHVQAKLVNESWPSDLLKMAECKPCRDEDGKLIWAGLAVRMGMAYGKIGSKKPTNTGCADYFGDLANTAARVSLLALQAQAFAGLAASRPRAEGGASRATRRTTGQGFDMFYSYSPGSVRGPCRGSWRCETRSNVVVEDRQLGDQPHQRQDSDGTFAQTSQTNIAGIPTPDSSPPPMVRSMGAHHGSASILGTLSEGNNKSRAPPASSRMSSQPILLASRAKSVPVPIRSRKSRGVHASNKLRNPQSMFLSARASVSSERAVSTGTLGVYVPNPSFWADVDPAGVAALGAGSFASDLGEGASAITLGRYVSAATFWADVDPVGVAAHGDTGTAHGPIEAPHVGDVSAITPGADVDPEDVAAHGVGAVPAVTHVETGTAHGETGTAHGSIVAAHGETGTPHGAGGVSAATNLQELSAAASLTDVQAQDETATPQGESGTHHGQTKTHRGAGGVSAATNLQELSAATRLTDVPVHGETETNHGAIVAAHGETETHHGAGGVSAATNLHELAVAASLTDVQVQDETATPQGESGTHLGQTETHHGKRCSRSAGQVEPLPSPATSGVLPKVHSSESALIPRTQAGAREPRKVAISTVQTSPAVAVWKILGRQPMSIQPMSLSFFRLADTWHKVIEGSCGEARTITVDQVFRGAAGEPWYSGEQQANLGGSSMSPQLDRDEITSEPDLSCIGGKASSNLAVGSMIRSQEPRLQSREENVSSSGFYDASRIPPPREACGGSQGISSGAGGAGVEGWGADTVVLKPIGKYLLKGIQHAPMLWQAQDTCLGQRRFPAPNGRGRQGLELPSKLGSPSLFGPGRGKKYSFHFETLRNKLGWRSASSKVVHSARFSFAPRLRASMPDKLASVTGTHFFPMAPTPAAGREGHPPQDNRPRVSIDGDEADITSRPRSEGVKRNNSIPSGIGGSMPSLPEMVECAHPAPPSSPLQKGWGKIPSGKLLTSQSSNSKEVLSPAVLEQHLSMLEPMDTLEDSTLSRVTEVSGSSPDVDPVSKLVSHRQELSETTTAGHMPPSAFSSGMSPPRSPLQIDVNTAETREEAFLPGSRGTSPVDDSGWNRTLPSGAVSAPLPRVNMHIHYADGKRSDTQTQPGRTSSALLQTLGNRSYSWNASPESSGIILAPVRRSDLRLSWHGGAVKRKKGATKNVFTRVMRALAAKSGIKKDGSDDDTRSLTGSENSVSGISSQRLSSQLLASRRCSSQARSLLPDRMRQESTIREEGRQLAQSFMVVSDKGQSFAQSRLNRGIGTSRDGSHHIVQLSRGSQSRLGPQFGHPGRTSSSSVVLPTQVDPWALPVGSLPQALESAEPVLRSNFQQLPDVDESETLDPVSTAGGMQYNPVQPLDHASQPN
eukprot:gene6610-3263_t